MKEFLQTNLNISLAEVAKRMWPDNAGSKNYMSAKLNGTRPWTDADTEKAKKALDEIYTGFTKQYKHLK